MMEIEKMKRYIERTGMREDNHNRYAINVREVFALTHTGMDRPIDAIDLAFEYGKAKGYRAAKAEVRR